MRILIVEDDTVFAHRLSAAVTAAGFAVVRSATDGEEARFLGLTTDYGAVVLDLGLPKLSGLEVLRQWRTARRLMPVMILSARGTLSERFAGLNLGTGDEMSKPFHAAEVVARLRALIRQSAADPRSLLDHGAITVDPLAYVVMLRGQPVDLTAQELRVLTCLMPWQGRIISQGDLAEHAYGMSEVPGSNTIEVFIARLRAKLARDAIRAVCGPGYRMDAS